ncbi:MAG: hypothetical protein H7Y42_14880 [Chitinophagaceae bacterium]|nr:hypothetical protein [Chitinophagaceae bacterium]
MKLINSTSFVLSLLLLAIVAKAQPINRKAVVQRHTVVNTKFDSLSSLSVGNGKFAFTVDATGLQSFPDFYARGVPLGTQSEWGWHSFIDTSGFSFEETLKDYTIHGRKVSYGVQVKEPEKATKAVTWFRQNPHRLQLGNIGIEIIMKSGAIAGVSDITNVSQTLDMWTGEIHSRFMVDGASVEVFTYGHGDEDAISVRLNSSLVKEGRIYIRVRFPYPTGDWKDVGNNWSNNDRHQSSILENGRNKAVLQHNLDTTRYYTSLAWNGMALLKEKAAHYFLLVPTSATQFEFSCRFEDNRDSRPVQTYASTAANSQFRWKNFWNSGGFVDFAGSTDKRAIELERRVILSQYLTKVQCAGQYPPQETGLTYNSWYGKPHLEMHWWHGIHFALWGRTPVLEKSLNWYSKVSDKARAIAKRQGYDGLRWQKMTDNNGDEAPSSVGAFLIWQQPHFIYFTELAFRASKSKVTLEKYKDLVFATADFMASYAYDDPATNRYILGPGLIPAQERWKAEVTMNPAYELVYWHWALETAQQWRKRLNLPRSEKWDAILARLFPLAIQEGRYLFTSSGTDSYTNPEYITDHPSVLGAWGMMPKTRMIDRSVMQRTFDWIWTNWSWKDTWGWDFPMTAMTATRLGMPDKAIDALLMPVQTNTYLNNGHNYQDERLTIYLPGNGGLLAAVAMMVAGYEGSTQPMPGIPKKGWKVRWEGLVRMI